MEHQWCLKRCYYNAELVGAAAMADAWRARRPFCWWVSGDAATATKPASCCVCADVALVAAWLEAARSHVQVRMEVSGPAISESGGLNHSVLTQINDGESGLFSTASSG